MTNRQPTSAPIMPIEHVIQIYKDVYTFVCLGPKEANVMQDRQFFYCSCVTRSKLHISFKILVGQEGCI